MAQHDLQELVEYPNERLAAEYKDWLDLARDIEARANLARRYCQPKRIGSSLRPLLSCEGASTHRIPEERLGNWGAG